MALGFNPISLQSDVADNYPLATDILLNSGRITMQTASEEVPQFMAPLWDRTLTALSRNVTLSAYFRSSLHKHPIRHYTPSDALQTSHGEFTRTIQVAVVGCHLS